jgi:ferredoxin-type protein NapH
MTGLHRDQLIPEHAAVTRESRPLYATLRKIRLFFVVGIGALLSNGYYPVVFSKQIYDGPLKQACVPFLNCHACPTAFMACPIGILQYFAAVRQIPLFLLGMLGSIGMLFGRAACGWLCPFGWVQDTLHKIPGVKLRLPRLFKAGKYLSLAVLAILLPFLTEDHWFSRICPWGTMIAGIPWMLWNPIDPTLGAPVIEPDMVGWLYVLKLSVLGIFLILFVLIKRPFCRALCPLGAIYAYFNRLSLMRMQVEGKCADCELCVKVCPVDIKISDDPNSPDCIRCLKCTVCKHVSVTWGPTYERDPAPSASTAPQSGCRSRG